MSSIEVDLDGLIDNLSVIRSVLASSCKIMGIVKADAYGHGAVLVGRALIDNGISMLGVASIDEGLELRRGGIDIPVLVLSEVPSSFVSTALSEDLILTVHSHAFLKHVAETAKVLNKTAKIHIKVDTGMGRLGFLPGGAFSAVLYAASLPCVVLEGIFTHLANAEKPADSYTEAQIDTFLKLLKNIKSQGIDIPIAHMANSAGIFFYPESHLDMVRPGISLYGIFPGQITSKFQELKEILIWKTKFIQIKWLPAGAGLSYGVTFSTRRKTLIGVLRVGYADGYDRMLSNCGQVLVRGRRVSVVGRICMDSCMVDLTELPEVDMNDDVVLLGSQHEKKISASFMADLCDTIPYEIFCKIGRRSNAKF